MQFDLAVIPFSRLGSYFAISKLPGHGERDGGLYLRSVHGHPHHPDNMGEFFKMEVLLEGRSVPFETVASPALLQLEVEGKSVRICIPEGDLLRIKGNGLGIRLRAATSMFDNLIRRRDDLWQATSHSLQTKFMLRALEGSVHVDAPWRVDRSEYMILDFLPDPDAKGMECTIEEFLPVWEGKDLSSDFEEDLARVEAEFKGWLRRMPQVSEIYSEARSLAGYIDWSAIVPPGGLLARPAMLMSKNWMTSLWSWDNCFNAIALSYGLPEIAWDQFAILMDHQHESGVFPDSINDRLIYWTFCKPPIHGWALKKMMEISDFYSPDHLEEIYEPLCRWTQWWFDYRDDDRDGIPQYNHGNDSGWDNATVFDQGPPIESPDLAAFLILQMEALAEVAEKLGKGKEARIWSGRSKTVLQILFSHSWKVDRFVAPQSGSHQVRDSDSLLLFLPLILGRRLPGGARQRMIQDLLEEGRYLTRHGLASESLRSPHYEPDGYWRGPIWAPSTMLMVEALAACGELEVAKDISRRFCDMASRSGMAENYNAQSGEGLRDQAYTWTSSVFLYLAHEYLLDEA